MTTWTLMPPAQLVKKVGMPGSAVCVHWSPRINQLFVGVGDAKQGSTQVLYTPSLAPLAHVWCPTALHVCVVDLHSSTLP